MRKVFINAFIIMMWVLTMYVTFSALSTTMESEVVVFILVSLFAGCLILSSILTNTDYDKTIIKEHTKEVVNDPEKLKGTLHICIHHPKKEKPEVKVFKEEPHKLRRAELGFEEREPETIQSCDIDFYELFKRTEHKKPHTINIKYEHL